MGSHFTCSKSFTLSGLDLRAAQFCVFGVEDAKTYRELACAAIERAHPDRMELAENLVRPGEKFENSSARSGKTGCCFQLTSVTSSKPGKVFFCRTLAARNGGGGGGAYIRLVNSLPEVLGRPPSFVRLSRGRLFPSCAVLGEPQIHLSPSQEGAGETCPDPNLPTTPSHFLSA